MTDSNVDIHAASHRRCQRSEEAKHAKNRKEKSKLFGQIMASPRFYLLKPRLLVALASFGPNSLRRGSGKYLYTLLLVVRARSHAITTSLWATLERPSRILLTTIALAKTSNPKRSAQAWNVRPNLAQGRPRDCDLDNWPSVRKSDLANASASMPKCHSFQGSIKRL